MLHPCVEMDYLVSKFVDSFYSHNRTSQCKFTIVNMRQTQRLKLTTTDFDLLIKGVIKISKYL